MVRSLTEIIKDNVEIQVQNSNQIFDPKEYTERGWVVISSKPAEKYRQAILTRLYLDGVAKVIAVGKYLGKLLLVVNWFLLERIDSIKIKQVQFDVMKSNRQVPLGVLKVIIERRDRNV